MLIVLVAASLRLYRLEEQSVADDASIISMSAPTITSCLAALRDLMPENTRLFYALQYCWGKAVGTAPYNLRILNLLLNICTVLMLYQIGCEIRGKTTGLIVGLSAALSSTLLYHSQSLTPYSLLMLCEILSFYSFWRMLQKESYSWAVINTLMNICVVWTHMDALFVLVAEGFVLLVLRFRTPKIIVFWGGLHLLAHIPTLTYLLNLPPVDLPGAYEFFQPSTFYSFFAILFGFDSANLNQDFAIAQLRIWPSISEPYASVLMRSFIKMGSVLFVVNVMFFLMLIGKTFHACRRLAMNERFSTDEEKRKAESLVFLLFLYLIPPSILAIISHLWQPYFFPRYNLSVLLVLTVINGVMIGGMRRRLIRWGSAFLLFALLFSQISILAPGNARTNWHSLTRDIYADATEGDIVLVGGDYHLAQYFLNTPKNSLPVICLPLSHVYSHIPDVRTDAFSAASISRRYLEQLDHGTCRKSVWFTYVRMYQQGPLPDMEEAARAEGLTCEFREYPGGESLKRYRLSLQTPSPPNSLRNPLEVGPVTKFLGEAPDIQKAQTELRYWTSQSNFILGSLTPLFYSVSDPRQLQRLIAPFERAGLLENAGIILRDSPRWPKDPAVCSLMPEGGYIIGETDFSYTILRGHLVLPRIRTTEQLLCFLKGGAIPSPSEKEVDTFLEEGAFYRAAFYYDKSMRALEKGLALDIRSIGLWASLATTKAAMKDDEGAMEAVENVCALDEKLRPWLHPLAKALFRTHDAQRVRTCLKLIPNEITLANEWMQRIRQLDLSDCGNEKPAL